MANLLRRRMGGVCVPGTSESERMTASRSTSSAAKQQAQGGEARQIHACTRISNFKLKFKDNLPEDDYTDRSQRFYWLIGGAV